MEYAELKITVRDEEHAEIITAMLADFPFEAFDEDAGVLRAYIAVAEYDACRMDIEELLASLEVEWAVQHIVQQNWNAAWESDFEPVRVEGDTPILIRAPHHEPAAEGVVDVVIAPRMSFGTGHHATTALMSRTIAEMDFCAKHGLDMGCGTGVLAIVAVKCGAQSMVAVDIDDWACDSCRDSIALSRVAESVDVRCGSMQVVASEKFDFILANINRNILIDMMPSFAEALTVGGELLMSGFFTEDIPSIESIASQYGFSLERTAERDGWAVMVCSKNR